MPERIEDNNILWYQKSDPNRITGQDLYKYYLEITEGSYGKENYAKKIVLDHLKQHLFKKKASNLFNEKKIEFEKELQKNQPNLMTKISSESLNSVDSARSTDSTNSQFEIIELQSYYKEFNGIKNNLNKLKEFENKVQDKITDLKMQVKIYELSKQKIQTKKSNTFVLNKTKKQEHAATIEQLIETINNVNNKITQYEMLLSQIEDKMSTLVNLVLMKENHFNQRAHVVEDDTKTLKQYFQSFEENYVTTYEHLQLNMQQSNSVSVPGLIKDLHELKLAMINVYQNGQYERVSLVNCTEMVEMLTYYVDIFKLYINLFEPNNTVPEDVKSIVLTNCQDFIELIESERQLFSEDDCEQQKWLGFNMFDIIIREIVIPYLKLYLKTPEEVRGLTLELQEKQTFLTTMITRTDQNFNALKSANDLDKLNVYVSSSTPEQQLNRRLEKSKSIQSIKKNLSKSSSMFNIFSSKPSDDKTKQEELEREIKKLNDEIQVQENLRELIQKFESQQNPKSFLRQGGKTKRRRQKRTRKNKRTHKKRLLRKSKKIRRNNYV